MADDLSAAPSMGASEPAPASVDTGSAPSSASDAPKSESKPLSGREAAQRAISEVMAKAPGETDRAAAVLKEGVGADDKLDANHKDAVDQVTAAEKAANEASERVKRGWETRRANMEQAKAEERTAEQISEAVKAAVPPPAEKAAEPTPAQVETKHPEAPKWMTKQSAAEWQKLPEVVREEVVKRSEAFDKGIQQYKEGAERWTDLAEYAQMSEQYYKQPLKDTLKNYAQLDRDLSNPETALGALEKIVSGMKYQAEDGNTYNWDLPQLAQFILDQNERGVSSFQNPQADLQRKLDDALSRLDRFEKGQTDYETQRVQQERERSTRTIESQIETFAKANTRFDELFPDMEMILSSPKFQKSGDPVADLKSAYEKAERLNPAPSLSPPAPALPAQDTAAQTRRGTASITGAPSGSTPAGKRVVASSPREAARMALSKMGMGSGA